MPESLPDTVLAKKKSGSARPDTLEATPVELPTSNQKLPTHPTPPTVLFVAIVVFLVFSRSTL